MNKVYFFLVSAFLSLVVGVYFGYSIRDSNARKEIQDARVLGATIFCLDIGDENGEYMFDVEECPQLVNKENNANAYATPLAWYQDRTLIEQDNK